MSEALSVVLIEDNVVDVEAVRRALHRQKIANPVLVARDGREGLALLRSGRVERPFLILLDLNLPRMNGLEFLRELRADPELRDSVVFVLTTSKAEEDRAASYDEHVAGYMVKGSLGDGFRHLAELLNAYWRVVELPVEPERDRR